MDFILSCIVFLTIVLNNVCGGVVGGVVGIVGGVVGDDRANGQAVAGVVLDDHQILGVVALQGSAGDGTEIVAHRGRHQNPAGGDDIGAAERQGVGTRGVEALAVGGGRLAG